MKLSNKFSRFLVMGSLLLAAGFAACSDDDDPEDKGSENPYVLALGITAEGATTYYVVDTDKLTEGTISALGQGIEQTGYHYYQQFGNHVMCIGGLGVTEVKSVTHDADGKLVEKGTYAFDKGISEMVQIDNNTIAALEVPRNPNSGDQIKIYIVNLNSVAITDSKTTPVASLISQIPPVEDNYVWPIPTGAAFSGNKIYLSYYECVGNNSSTPWMDKGRIAIFSYPGLQLESIIDDDRTGPIGSWLAHNGMITTENGDMYLMSNSSIPNGFSQSGKTASFTRIPRGATAVDDYYFDFGAISGNMRPAHLVYLGNNLVFAEVSTITDPVAGDRYGDAQLKCCIIDLKNKTVKDVSGIPLHKGGGGGAPFVVLADGGSVHLPIATEAGLYLYKTDVATATATQGAKVTATFVQGIFHID